jgi:hypothetical protein
MAVGRTAAGARKAALAKGRRKRAFMVGYLEAGQRAAGRANSRGGAGEGGGGRTGLGLRRPWRWFVMVLRMGARRRVVGDAGKSSKSRHVRGLAGDGQGLELTQSAWSVIAHDARHGHVSYICTGYPRCTVLLPSFHCTCAKFVRLTQTRTDVIMLAHPLAPIEPWRV